MKLMLPLLTVSILALTACTAGGPSGTSQENAITHTVTAADLAYVQQTTPVTSDKVRLYVNGMGCPQCVSNVDIQLARLKGVKQSRVNLGNGTVDVDLWDKNRPSPAQLAKAVSGDFTLVKIEEVK